MTDRGAQNSLLVERALRAAAGSGNRLLSAGGARLTVSDPELRSRLVVALERCGARFEPGAPVDFVFADALDGGDAISAAGAPRAGGPDPGLPPVVVGLDGGVASARGTGAAERIAWAARGMRATGVLARRLREANDGRAPRIAVSLVLEPKTAALAIALADAGCEVAVFSAASETDPAIASALAETGRVAVFAPTGGVVPDDAVRLDAEHAAAVLRWGPEYLVDDGAHLIRLAHTEHPEVFDTLRAAAEETTSGVRPLREMAGEGALRIPVIAVNDARTKTGFDNLIGTGQSCVFAIGDLLDGADWAGPSGDDDDGVPGAYRGLAGTRWVVIGYGPVGVGVARFASALGASVTAVERDPVRALAALHDGFEARGLEDALATADVVVSATGVWHTLDATGFARLRPGAAVAVAGGIDDELALDELRAAGWRRASFGHRVEEWIPPGGERGPLVLAEGGGVNYSASEGNPVEVMDLSFATQLAALIRLMTGAAAPGVHALTAEDELLVARAALAARGGSAEWTRGSARPGGAAQPWTVHRYRRGRSEPAPHALDSSE